MSICWNCLNVEKRTKWQDCDWWKTTTTITTISIIFTTCTNIQKKRRKNSDRILYNGKKSKEKKASSSLGQCTEFGIQLNHISFFLLDNIKYRFISWKNRNIFRWNNHNYMILNIQSVTFFPHLFDRYIQIDISFSYLVGLQTICFFQFWQKNVHYSKKERRKEREISNLNLYIIDLRYFSFHILKTPKKNPEYYHFLARNFTENKNFG